MDSKPFWASKTIWINLIALVASLLAAFGVADWDAELQASIVGVVMTIVNIVLRFVTDKPVSTGGSSSG